MKKTNTYEMKNYNKQTFTKEILETEKRKNEK